MPNPILEVTDGTITINLLNSGGFRLRDWVPVRPELKGGGVWRGSPLSDGHQLVAAQYHNVIDTFSLICEQSSQDDLIRERQELDRLLIKAREYWTTDWQNEPVWIVAKGPDESEIRYAVIHSYAMPMDDNPYAQPFYPRGGECPVQEDLTLMLEHGFWQAEVPGTVVCVEASGQQTSIQEQAFWLPTQSADDCHVNNTASSIDFASISFFMGNDGANSWSGGVRFRSVTIPQGAKIGSAFIRFIDVGNNAGTVVRLRIAGEDNGTPAVFSTFANYKARPRTAAYTDWSPGAWLIGNPYDTDDIAAVVEEIVGRPDWATGNNLVVFVEDHGSAAVAWRRAASWDRAAGTEAELHVTYSLGQQPTCERDVYVANKHNMAQLTDAYTWETAAGPFGANMIGAVLPNYILARGAVGPNTGDITYFGCDSTVTNSGPFCSLVFDVLQRAVYAGAIGVDFVTWQYWNGGWVNLTPWDNTDATPRAGPTTQAWSRIGVNSIHWDQPSDWVPTAINGVTAYWVRCVVTEGNSIGPAAQDNRDIYTITWANIDISPTTLAGANQLEGDVPLLAKVTLQGAIQSATINGNERMFWMGLRGRQRGAAFQAFLNLSDEQNPTGITTSVGVNSAFATNVNSSTGRVTRYTVAGITADSGEAFLNFSTTVAPQYFGTYRLFCRYLTASGADGDVRMWYELASMSTAKIGDSVPLNVRTRWEVADLGHIQIPIGPTPDAGSPVGNTQLVIVLECLAGGAHVVDLMDVFLLPADEWAGLFYEESGFLEVASILELDSATRPKHAITSWLTGTPPTGYYASYVTQAAGPIILQSNAPAAQSIWMLQAGNDSTGPTDLPIEPYYYAVRAEVDAIHRYLSMRGNR